jgi:Leucine-rich repeat (LRR) protein
MDPKALSNLGALTKLNLTENFLNGMLSSLCGGLPFLEELHMDVNQLTALSPAVANWTNLKTLSLSDNLLTGSSQLIESHHYLTILSALPMESSHWSSMVSLNLKNNKIADLIGPVMQNWLPVCLVLQSFVISLDMLTTHNQMEKLYLGSNLLKRIPFEIGMLGNATELDFSRSISSSLIDPTQTDNCSTSQQLH